MRLLKLLIAFALCMSLAVVASAHPGRTDSNGGHYDRSTGEYHYHHGYSAHQHYDMDGDGLSDCPYEFKDNTKPSSSTTDSSNSHTTPSTTLPSALQALIDNYQNKQKVEATTEATEEHPTSKTNSHDKGNGIIKEYLIPIGGCVALYAVIWIVDEIKWRCKR